MSCDVYRVPPRSWEEIAFTAEAYRSALGLADKPFLPVIETLEGVMDLKLNLTSFQVGSQDEMGEAEGYTCPKGSFIMLREDVYNGAVEGAGRHRFTACHEWGHLALHANLPLARVPRGQKISSYVNSERQADHFAAEILMPAKFFGPDDDIVTVMNRHGVSAGAARNRLRFLAGRKQ